MTDVQPRGTPVPRLGTHNRLNYETPPASARSRIAQ
jgi:hypothetical protein